MTNGNDAAAFAAARDALEQANPTGWRWPDKDGNEHDGPELVGEYVADDHSERHGVDIALIRTADGRCRSLFFWRPEDGKPTMGYHLVPRWEAANPQIGDYVAIRQNKRPSTKNPGQSYNDYTVVAVRPGDTAYISADELAAVDAVAGVDENTETALTAERDERDALVDDHGTPIRY